MFEQWHYTIPLGTAEADRVSVECPISKGVITRLVLQPMFGNENYGRCRVMVGAKIIAPRSSGGYITGNGFPVDSGPMEEPTKGNIPKLVWELWNLDETYNHEWIMSCTWIESDRPDELAEQMRKSNEYLKALVESLVGVSM